MKNVKTTIAGGMLIAGSVLSFVALWLSTGHAPPAEAWAGLGAAITTGAGFIAAADGKKLE